MTNLMVKDGLYKFYCLVFYNSAKNYLSKLSTLNEKKETFCFMKGKENKLWS